MRHGKYRFIISFLAAPLLLYFVFVISPYAQAFYIALTDWRGFSARQNFVGLDNFVRLVQDPVFWTALKHNALLLLVVPIVTVALGLFFASMLNVGGRSGQAAIQGVRGSGFYKVVYFFPHMISIVIIAVLWQFVYNPQSGLLNGFLGGVGLGALKQTWLGDPNIALWAVMAVMVWSGAGFYVVLFSAAMQAIPRELYEASLLDGANRSKTFWYITLPLLWDSVQVALVYLGIIALDAFAIVQIMTAGGPNDSTEVIAHYLYNTAFQYGQFGYASALGVALFFLTLTLAFLTLRVTQRERLEF